MRYEELRKKKEDEAFKQLSVQEKLKDLYVNPAVISCKLARCTQEEIREIASILGYELNTQANIKKVVDFIVYEVRTQLKDQELQKFFAQNPKPEKLNDYLCDNFTHWELQHLMRKNGLDFQLSSGTSELSEPLTSYYKEQENALKL